MRPSSRSPRWEDWAIFLGGTSSRDVMASSSHSSSKNQVRIKADADGSFRSRLEQALEVGFVADTTLADGTECSAVLIAMSSTALILDRWDRSRRAPTGDPFTLELRSVAEVIVP